ncbi:MAG: 50S ribosomal protein L21 [Clostridia bacterium]|nr:50S ribosomal protein L21 [Clostridiaceae bacterium]
MFAIIETGGKQYKVQQDDVIFVEKLGVDEGEYAFDKVLALSDDTNIIWGTPYIQGASVKATVLGQGKDKKIIVFKYKSKKNYAKKQGHRQPHTKVRIDQLIFPANE